MQNGKVYVKKSSDSINKIKSIQLLPRDVIVKEDALGLYLFTHYKAVLKALT